MGRFFIDSIGGNDSNVGSSSARPWKSLAALDSAFTAGRVDRGDEVLIKRGSVLFGQMPVAPETSSGPGPRLLIGAYGTGATPLIRGYKIVTPGAWVLHSGQVWKVDLSAGNTATHSGNTAVVGGDFGHLLTDGKIRGARKTSLAGLAETWDFYTDPATNTLYVRTGADPATLAGEIGAAPKQSGMLLRSAITVEDIDFEGYGAHGWRVGGSSVRRGQVTVRRCAFRKIGGTTNGAGSRIGNGGEAWIGSFDVLSEMNTYEDIYDVAFTCQGGVDGAADRWERITSRRDTVINPNQAIEFWATGSAPTGGYKDVEIDRMLVINSGYSWGEAVRPDTDGRATQILTYAMQLPTDIEIHHCVFYGVKENYRFHSFSGNRTIPTGLNMHDNIVFAPEDALIQWGESYTMRDAAAWQEDTGQDAGTLFFPVPELTTATALEVLATETAAAKAIADLTVEATPTRPSAPADQGAMLSGRWYYPQRSSASTSNYSVQDEMAGQIWEPSLSGLVGRIAVEVTTGGTAGAVVRAGILRLRSDNGFDLIQDCGTLSAETTGVKEFTANVRVEQGELYWLAVAIQGGATGTVLRAAQNGLTDQRITGNSAALGLQGNLMGLKKGSVAGAFPASQSTIIGGETLVPVAAVRAV